MTALIDAPDARPGGGFAIVTVRSDTTRAALAVRGVLDADAAGLLRRVIDGHCRAGRRFLRINLDGVTSLTAATLEVFAIAHERLLLAKGTLILTGVAPELETSLRGVVAASPLLLMGPTAAAD